MRGFSRTPAGASTYLATLARTALILAPAALLEEIMFRGVGQVVLARAVGRMPAVILLSVGFAAAHLANPSRTPLGLINIALAGSAARRGVLHLRAGSGPRGAPTLVGMPPSQRRMRR